MYGEERVVRILLNYILVQNILTQPVMTELNMNIPHKPCIRFSFALRSVHQ